MSKFGKRLVMFISLATVFLHLWDVSSAILQYTGANKLILADPTPSPGLELVLSGAPHCSVL
jgi:hypothetical protein